MGCFDSFCGTAGAAVAPTGGTVLVIGIVDSLLILEPVLLPLVLYTGRAAGTQQQHYREF